MLDEGFDIPPPNPERKLWCSPTPLNSGILLCAYKQCAQFQCRPSYCTPTFCWEIANSSADQVTVPPFCWEINIGHRRITDALTRSRNRAVEENSLSSPRQRLRWMMRVSPRKNLSTSERTYQLQILECTSTSMNLCTWSSLIIILGRSIL